MSIAVLKRKTLNGNPRLAPISGSNNGSFGFSLNGTRRNIGSVGVTNLAPGAQSGPTQKIAHLVGSALLNRGSLNPDAIQGHPTSCCTNDHTVVKPSVINTRGMLSRRINCLPPQSEYRSCNGCNNCDNGNPPHGCYNWVKKPLYSGEQGEYIEKVVRVSGQPHFRGYVCDETKSTNGIVGKIDACGNILELGNTCTSDWNGIANPPITNFVGTKRITNKCTIAKPGILTVDYGTYMHKGLMKKHCLPQAGHQLKPWLLNSTHGTGCKDPDYTCICPGSNICSPTDTSGASVWISYDATGNPYINVQYGSTFLSDFSANNAGCCMSSYVFPNINLGPPFIPQPFNGNYVENVARLIPTSVSIAKVSEGLGVTFAPTMAEVTGGHLWTTRLSDWTVWTCVECLPNGATSQYKPATEYLKFFPHCKLTVVGTSGLPNPCAGTFCPTWVWTINLPGGSNPNYYPPNPTFC